MVVSCLRNLAVSTKGFEPGTSGSWTACPTSSSLLSFTLLSMKLSSFTTYVSYCFILLKACLMPCVLQWSCIYTAFMFPCLFQMRSYYIFNNSDTISIDTISAANRIQHCLDSFFFQITIDKWITSKIKIF